MIRQETGDDDVILVTHSLGRIVALALLDEYPDLLGSKITGLALISTAASRMAELAVPRPVAVALVRTQAARFVLRAGRWCAPVLDALKPSLCIAGRWWLRHTMFGTETPSFDLLTAKQHLWADTSAGVITAAYSSLLGFDRTGVLDALRRIPALVITGTDDRTILAARSEHLAAVIGERAELFAMPQAGHSVNQTHADAVNAALRSLVARSRR